MLTRITLSTLAAATVFGLALAPQSALADRPSHRGGPEYDYAKVTHVDPIVRRVRVERPVRECWDETRYEDPRYRPGGETTARTILGAAIGGVLGHQVGDGRGKDIATAAGAIIGAAVGNSAAKRSDARYAGGREYTVQRCENRIETVYEERIEGYDVEYRYHGRTYRTRMPYDPGDRIRIRVDVTPAR